MKTKLLIVIALLLTAHVAIHAQQATNEGSTKQTIEANDWDFFSLVFFPGVPSAANLTNCYGIRVGAPMSFGGDKVCGVETGVFCATTSRVYGIQTSPIFCMSDHVVGLQASPVNVAEVSEGIQFGIVNISEKASFQLGIVNYIRDAAIPVLPIINIRF